MERGGGGNLGWIQVKWGSKNEGGVEGLSREVGMESGGGGNLGWRMGGGSINLSKGIYFLFLPHPFHHHHTHTHTHTLKKVSFPLNIFSFFVH